MQSFCVRDKSSDQQIDALFQIDGSVTGLRRSDEAVRVPEGAGGVRLPWLAPGDRYGCAQAFSVRTRRC
jgi:hypothetical protein